MFQKIQQGIVDAAIEDYLGGLSRNKTAKKYGVHPKSITNFLKRAGLAARGTFSTFEDLTGREFHYWTAIRFHGRINNNTRWLCRCVCGTERPVQAGNLVNGATKSCGCKTREMISKKRRKHGHTTTRRNGPGRKPVRNSSPEYVCWTSMRRRCSRPNARGFEHYGGRGIKVCDRWQSSFENFLADMGPRPGPAYSIERMDNNGDYCPENCRWATRAEQQRNTRRARIVDWKGESRTLAEWQRVTGIRGGTIANRLKFGWTVEQAMTIPVGLRRDGQNCRHRLAAERVTRTVQILDLIDDAPAPL
jgi:hypothetical protein